MSYRQRASRSAPAERGGHLRPNLVIRMIENRLVAGRIEKVRRVCRGNRDYSGGRSCWTASIRRFEWERSDSISA